MGEAYTPSCTHMDTCGHDGVSLVLRDLPWRWSPGLGSCAWSVRSKSWGFPRRKVTPLQVWRPARISPCLSDSSYNGPPPHPCLLHFLLTMNQGPRLGGGGGSATHALDRRKACLGIPNIGQQPLLYSTLRATDQSNAKQQMISKSSGIGLNPACLLAGGSEEPHWTPKEGRTLTPGSGQREDQSLGDPTCPSMVDPGRAQAQHLHPQAAMPCT